jgi:hypothetical protein
MKRNIIQTITVAVSIIAMVACGGPKVIPDETLGNIFRDIYMVNAYAPSVPTLKYDSVDVYLPVLQKYGYDTDDFVNTLASFSKRKSARLSSIVDDAIAKLTRTSDSLTRKVAALDFIDSVAFARAASIVYRDSLIEIRGKADSAAMKVKIPASEGRYQIAYNYRLDSLDKNSYLYNRHYVRDSMNRSVANNSVRLLASVEKKPYNASLNSPAGADSLELTFGNYPSDSKRMHLTIDSLVIEHFPPHEVALELLMDSLNYNLLINDKEIYEYYNLPAQDSCALHILARETPPQPDTLAVE